MLDPTPTRPTKNPHAPPALVPKHSFILPTSPCSKLSFIHPATPNYSFLLSVYPFGSKRSFPPLMLYPFPLGFQNMYTSKLAKSRRRAPIMYISKNVNACARRHHAFPTSQPPLSFPSFPVTKMKSTTFLPFQHPRHMYYFVGGNEGVPTDAFARCRYIKN